MILRVWVGTSLVTGLLFGALHHLNGAQVSDAQGSEVTEVPLAMLNGQLIVPVESADGTSYHFALGTASLTTIYTQAGAERIPDDAVLTLGGLPIPTDDVEVISSNSPLGDGSMLDGIIGPNMLSEFEILIDVQGSRLLIRPVGPPADWSGYTLTEPVKLRVFHGLLMNFDVALNGKPFGAMLDLWAASLIVNSPVHDALGIEVEDEAALSVGDYGPSKLPVRVRDLDLFSRWDPNSAGFVVVGNAIAEDCVIALSWARSEMRMCVK